VPLRLPTAHRGQRGVSTVDVICGISRQTVGVLFSRSC
jgi:hypothetical protein